jgi:hypothetical protein
VPLQLNQQREGGEPSSNEAPEDKGRPIAQEAVPINLCAGHPLLACPDLREQLAGLLGIQDQLFSKPNRGPNPKNRPAPPNRSNRLSIRLNPNQGRGKRALTISSRETNQKQNKTNGFHTSNTAINMSLSWEKTVFQKRPSKQVTKTKRNIVVKSAKDMPTDDGKNKLVNTRNFGLSIGVNVAIKRPNMCDCLVDRKRRIIMAFTPRASCTLAVSMFIHHMGLYQEAKEVSDWIHHYRRTVLEKKPQYIANAKDWENPHIIKIKVVRNPYYRAVSCYTHFIRSIDSNLSFEQYLISMLENRIDDLNNHELMIRDYHGKSQRTQWDHSINHIVKVEQLERELKLLDYRYNTSMLDSYQSVRAGNSHIMTKDHQIKEFVGEKEGNFFRRPNREFKIPDYQYFYNQRVRCLVEKLYGDDIRYFNYEWPFAAGEVAS